MKFEVSSSKLFAQLQALSRVIVPKQALPIMENILFDLHENVLTLTASDSEVTIRTSIIVDAFEGEGKVAFDGKLLVETLKAFSEQPLTFNIDDRNFKLIITSANGNYSFVGMNGNEYPEIQNLEEGARQFNMAAGTLLEGISKTIFCTADDELRPVMNGINIDLQEDRLTLVATDAHRLVRFTDTTVKTAEPTNIILPKKPANLLKNVLTKEDNEVDIHFDSKTIRFAFGSTLMVCRQIEGRFPNYNAVIPQNNQNKVIADRQTLINACKRVAVFSSPSTGLIRLGLSEDQIRISAQDIDFSTSAEETLSCSYNGMPMAIGFKAPFLIELLGAIDSQEVMIELADPARAGLILPTENDDTKETLMLLMPMLLNE
ncbi:MAG: DNA polymerase III subunit beta [Paludibacteraceae bacterium]|nr:DNA polymerase III subunit beta [Paludibacteraceae bacterium]